MLVRLACDETKQVSKSGYLNFEPGADGGCEVEISSTLSFESQPYFENLMLQPFTGKYDSDKHPIFVGDVVAFDHSTLQSIYKTLGVMVYRVMREESSYIFRLISDLGPLPNSYCTRCFHRGEGSQKSKVLGAWVEDKDWMILAKDWQQSLKETAC